MEQIINNRYKIIEKLKEGRKFTTYKGFDLKDKKEVAIKVVDLKKNGEADITKIKNELNIINKIDSKYSIKCYESFSTLSEMYIILEYCRDNLLDKMKTLEKDSKIYYIKKVFTQLMEVYKILHQNNLIIRELKPEKILIKYTNEDETEFDIKLSDYNFSKQLADNDSSKTIIGYSVYVAPEISRGYEYTNKCDLWSIGVLGHVLYFGKVPSFKGMLSFEQDIIIPEYETLQDLLQKLLDPVPEKRITWDEFFNHKFFKQKIFGEITKKDFDEVCKKYPKREDLEGVNIEVIHDEKNNIYAEIIKGTAIFHGRGIYVEKNSGMLVKGYFANGKLCGKGEVEYSDGQFYEGEFLNDLRFGKGKKIFSNGVEYIGDFKNNLYDGIGTLKYNNGDIYEGGFVNGKKFGKGKYYYKKSGQRFEGEWLNDLKNGKGTIYFDDGKKIEGNWKNGLKDGEFKKYKNKDIDEFTVEIYQNGVKKDD